MLVLVTVEHIGDPMARQEVSRTVEEIFQDRLGEWRVSIIGSQANDRWEMKVEGPNMFERSYTLEGSAGSIGRRLFCVYAPANVF